MTLSPDYFAWLISQIAINGQTPRSYRQLFTIMYSQEFSLVPAISGDDNRVQDAMDLRHYYLDEADRSQGQVYFPEFVSILEVLIALSRRMAFIAGGEAPQWAWQLLENLGLERAVDPLTQEQQREVFDILERFVWRTYKPNGEGGLFPLSQPQEDQRKVELWYQMNAYVNEIREPV